MTLHIHGSNLPQIEAYFKRKKKEEEVRLWGPHCGVSKQNLNLPCWHCVWVPRCLLAVQLPLQNPANNGLGKHWKMAQILGTHNPLRDLGWLLTPRTDWLRSSYCDHRVVNKWLDLFVFLFLCNPFFQITIKKKSSKLKVCLH